MRRLGLVGVGIGLCGAAVAVVKAVRAGVGGTGRSLDRALGIGGNLRCGLGLRCRTGLNLSLAGLRLCRVLVALHHGGLSDRVLDLGLLRILRLLPGLSRLLLTRSQGGRSAQGRQRTAIGHCRVVLNVDVHHQLGVIAHSFGNLAGLGLQK